MKMVGCEGLELLKTREAGSSRLFVEIVVQVNQNTDRMMFPHEYVQPPPQHQQNPQQPQPQPQQSQEDDRSNAHGDTSTNGAIGGTTEASNVASSDGDTTSGKEVESDTMNQRPVSLLNQIRMSR